MQVQRHGARREGLSVAGSTSEDSPEDASLRYQTLTTHQSRRVYITLVCYIYLYSFIFMFTFICIIVYKLL